MHSFLLVGLLLGQSPAPKSSVAELSPSKVFTLRAPATFVVVVGERQGSAVAYAEKRLATNAHVVGDAKEVVLRQGAESWKGRVLAVDEVRDVALIESERALPALAPLRKDEPAIGERVFAIGAPQGLELSLSDGLVSGLREEDGLRWLQTTAPMLKSTAATARYHAPAT